MRVISGSAKGRTLKGPPSHATRPMADKIKGALFNSLASLGVAPEVVLDLYAGTGSIGIEALSRGATKADFVERTRDACQVIRDNLAVTGFAHIAAVHQAPVMTFIGAGRSTYDFVILDPPYADPDIIPTLTALQNGSLVHYGSIVVIGHSPRVELPDRLGRLDRLRLRCHGDSCFSIYDVADATRDDGPAPQPSSEEAEHANDARDLSGKL
ncbi:MAG: RsmD family RNA methyltransferase [Chloroflexia bacterium]|nr:RsmD family RNA methyltransferase [Chloroflexia bacterium]